MEIGLCHDMAEQLLISIKQQTLKKITLNTLFIYVLGSHQLIISEYLLP